MKKRTYKRMQNRLYREIKRRMLLEHAIAFPSRVNVEQRKIDRIKIGKHVSMEMFEHDKHYLEYEKREIAHAIAEKMLDDGYIVFNSRLPNFGQMYDCMEVQAWVDVVMPSMRIENNKYEW